MFLSRKILSYVGLVTVLVTATSANAASTNPWAMPQQLGQYQGNSQGGFNMGGGFSFGGGGQSQGNLAARNPGVPQFVAPQPVLPVQPATPRVAPQPAVPAPARQQFGIYPPLSTNNSQTTLHTPQAAPRVAPQPVRPSYQAQPYGYRQVPYGYNSGNNPGYGGFGFPGFGNFGGFPGFNNFGFNNFGFGFGFGGGGLVAPGPAMPGYGNPYFQNYQQPRYQPQPGRTTN